MTIKEIYNFALQFHQGGQLAEAERYYRRILAEQPAYADAMQMLGVLGYQSGRYEEALGLIKQAIAINSHNGSYFCNLGLVLAAMGKLDEAAEAYQRSLGIDPLALETYYNLGNTLRDLRRPAEAVAAYQKSLMLRPDNAAVLTNMGSVLRSMGQLDDAMAAYRKAMAHKPDHFEAVHNLANVLKEKGDFDEAIFLFQHAGSLRPNHPAIFQNMGHTLYAIGDVDRAIQCYGRAVALKPDDSALASQRLFALSMHPDYDARQLLAEHKQWAERFGKAGETISQAERTRPASDGRLRLGYISGDFFDHVLGWIMLGLLQRHDRSQFEIYCYANVLHPDATSKRLESLSDHWRNIQPLDDDQAAQLILSDGIDILVDLSVHTAGNRLPVLARKPAPVQVTYLGGLGTTGLGAMDYRLSDPYIDPADTDLTIYSEQTIRIPSYWCYQPGMGGAVPEVAEAPALRNGYVTFGSFGSITKASNAALDTWGVLMAGVPESRLLINCPPGTGRLRVLDRLGAKGVAADRVGFTRPQPWPEYMRNFERIDITLDPFPYGGAVSNCDSLWMGVPVVSLSGRTSAGRGGSSILSNAGLPELVAGTHEEYIGIASDWKRWIERRPTMRQRMRESPLMDEKRFMGDLESAYRSMYEEKAKRETSVNV